MNEFCRYESIITSCAVSGIWNEEAVHHLSICPECRQVVQLAEATRGLAVASPLRPLPDPDLLWLTAQIMKKQDRLDRLRWRIQLFEIFSFVLVGGCTLLAFNSIKLDVGFEEVAASVQRLVSPLNDLSLVTFASLVAAIALLGICLWVHPLLSDD